MLLPPRRRVCPYCGNDRMIDVTMFERGKESGRRTFCAGTLGCHAWWDAGDETIDQRAASFARSAGTSPRTQPEPVRVQTRRFSRARPGPTLMKGETAEP